MNERDLLVEQLAKMVVRGNLENYKTSCIECDVKETATDFKRFGTTDETVKQYMIQLVDEVLEKTIHLQNNVADILFD